MRLRTAIKAHFYCYSAVTGINLVKDPTANLGNSAGIPCSPHSGTQGFIRLSPDKSIDGLVEAQQHAPPIADPSRTLRLPRMAHEVACQDPSGKQD